MGVLSKAVAMTAPMLEIVVSTNHLYHVKGVLNSAGQLSLINLLDKDCIYLVLYLLVSKAEKGGLRQKGFVKSELIVNIYSQGPNYCTRIKLTRIVSYEMILVEQRTDHKPLSD